MCKPIRACSTYSVWIVQALKTNSWARRPLIINVVHESQNKRRGTPCHGLCHGQSQTLFSLVFWKNVIFTWFLCNDNLFKWWRERRCFNLGLKLTLFTVSPFHFWTNYMEITLVKIAFCHACLGLPCQIYAPRYTLLQSEQHCDNLKLARRTSRVTHNMK